MVDIDTYYNNGTIYLNDLTPNSNTTIIATDLSGRNLWSTELWNTSAHASIDIPFSYQGIVLFNVLSATQTTTLKAFIDR